MNDRLRSMTEIFGGPIHTYGRAEAIEDGILVDVTETAREAGFSIPVGCANGSRDAAPYVHVAVLATAIEAFRDCFHGLAPRFWVTSRVTTVFIRPAASAWLPWDSST